MSDGHQSQETSSLHSLQLDALEGATGQADHKQPISQGILTASPPAGPWDPLGEAVELQELEFVLRTSLHHSDFFQCCPPYL